MIDHVDNDKKVSEYSQLCLKCVKSFTCAACSFKYCSRNNLTYHMQNYHKVSINYAIPWDYKEREIFKSLNNSSYERSAQNISKSKINFGYYFFFFSSLIWFMTYFLVNTKKNIEVYCVKCDNISSPATVCKRQTCRVCGTSAIYQCKICNRRYTNPHSIYNHVRNECINVEPQYKCSQCDYKSKRKADLQRHIKTKHSYQEVQLLLLQDNI